MITSRHARLARPTPSGTVPAATLALVAVLAASALTFAIPAPARAASVFLDPGHGGRYPGAVYAGVEEQYVNLLIALETERVLESRGHDVLLSRYGDADTAARDRPTWHWNESSETYSLFADGKTGIYSNDGSSPGIPYDDLQARCDTANAWGADVFLAIHNNAGGSASGTETFYNSWTTDTDTLLSARLASYVQEGVVAAAGTRDRGTADVGYYVIRWANMPAALIEVQFLSNATERARLLTPAFRHSVAVGIANGIDRYLASDPCTARERRVEGADRYATAAAAALEGWPLGADTVLLASGEQWPDALAAGPLSISRDAPLLLTPTSSLHAATADAMERLGPSRIVVLGGEGAVSTQTVEAARAAAAIPVEAVSRIAGANRYETAALIAEQVGVAGGTVVVVSGESYADALSVGSYASMNGYPVLLTHGQAPSAELAGFLDNHASGIARAVVVGGPGVVSPAAVGSLDARLDVEWLYGADRYATNLAVIKRFWGAGAVVPFVASAWDFPDALAAGAIAGQSGQPVLLCGSKYLPASTREWIMHNTLRISSFTLMGGPGALSLLLEWELEKARR